MNADISEKRLINAKKSKNPLSVAIICYQVLRESPRFLFYKNSNNEKGMKEVIYTSIGSMFKILEKDGWDEEMINKFFQHMKDFVKEI